MRFLAVLNSYANAEAFSVMRFPCAGVLKNLSFQIWSEPTEVIDQDMWRIGFGDINRNNLAWSSPLTDDAFEVLQSARDPSKIIIQGIDFQNENVGGSAVNNRFYFYHSSRTLRIRNDREYLIGVWGKPVNSKFFILVQGEFYPYKNAYTKIKYLLDGIDDADDRKYEYVVPTGLKNAVLEYDAYVSDTEATEIAARVVPRIQPFNQINLMPAGTLLSGKGVVDGTEDTGGDIVYGGTIDDFIIGTAASGLASKEGVIPIRNILRAGDKIVLDIVNLKGDITDAEVVKLALTLHGRATGEKTATRSHFLDSNFIIQPTKEVFE